MMEAFIIILFVVGMIALLAWMVYGLKWITAYNKKRSAELIEDLDDDGNDGQQN